MRRSSLRLECFEPRRMMDAGGLDCFSPNGLIADSSAVPSSLSARTGGEPLVAQGNELDALGVANGSGFSGEFSAALSIAYPSTRLFRSDSTVLAIATVNDSGEQNLWAIREGGEAGGEVTFELDLGKVRIHQVLFDGDRAVLIGDQGWDFTGIPGIRPFDLVADFPASPKQVVMALDLTTGTVVDQIELPAGLVKHASFSGAEALIISQRTDLYVPAIWPPVETNDEVVRFTWDVAGLSEPTTDEIPSGQVTVVGDRILVTSISYDYTNNGLTNWIGQNKVQSFVLTDDGIDSQGSVNLGRGNLLGLKIHSNGEQAVAVVSTGNRTTTAENLPFGRDARWTTKALLINLTGTEPAIAETIELPQTVFNHSVPGIDLAATMAPIQWNFPLELLSQDEDHLVFQDRIAGELIIVDLSAEVTGAARLKTVELPDGILASQEFIRLNDNQIVFITGSEYWRIPLAANGTSSQAEPGSADPSLPILIPPRHPVPSEGSLLTLSLGEGTVKVQKVGEGQWLSQLELIDDATGQIGFQSPSNSGVERRYIFGKFNNEGLFVAEGEVASNTYLEVFVPHEDSVSLVSDGGIKTYTYENPEEPWYVINFVDPDAPPLLANDDAIKLYSSLPVPAEEFQSGWIDLLANDQVPYQSRFRTQVVELIDAPAGVNLEGGRFVWLDSRVKSLTAPIVFSYRLSDGLSESIAEVEITIAEVTQEQRAAMIDAIKDAVVREFGMDRDRLVVEPIARLIDREGIIPLPLLPHDNSILPWPNTNGGGSLLTQSPTFAFRVTAPGFKAIYGSDLMANAFLFSVLERDDDDDDDDDNVRQSVVELQLVATDGEGNRIESAQTGESFWLELRGTDLRRNAKGLFSSYLNLSLPPSLSFEGTVEPGQGFAFIEASKVADRVSPQSISGLGVMDADGAVSESTDSRSQVLMRVRVTANQVGNVALVPAPSQNIAHETVVFNSDRAIPESEIRRTPVAFRVVSPEATEEPLDVDDDGTVKALDALLIINMISRHGVGTIAEIEAKMGAEAASSPIHVGRFDVNGSGSITALDALQIINHIGRRGIQSTVSNDRTQLSANGEDISMTLVNEDEDRKRRRR